MWGFLRQKKPTFGPFECCLVLFMYCHVGPTTIYIYISEIQYRNTMYTHNHTRVFHRKNVFFVICIWVRHSSAGYQICVALAPPQSILNYWQEVGRCARGSENGLILLNVLRPLFACSLLAKLGQWGWWWGWGWLETKARRHQKDYIEIRPEAPGVWTKDLINFIPIYCHHWECRLGPVQVRQACEYLRGVKCSSRRPPTTGS